jgi:hypothetical protein
MYYNGVPLATTLDVNKPFGGNQFSQLVVGYATDPV